MPALHRSRGCKPESPPLLRHLPGTSSAGCPVRGPVQFVTHLRELLICEGPGPACEAPHHLLRGERGQTRHHHYPAPRHYQRGSSGKFMSRHAQGDQATAVRWICTTNKNPTVSLPSGPWRGGVRSAQTARSGAWAPHPPSAEAGAPSPQGFVCRSSQGAWAPPPTFVAPRREARSPKANHTPDGKSPQDMKLPDEPQRGSCRAGSIGVSNSVADP